MSVKVMSLLWDRSELKGSNLLVMLAIGDNAKDNGLAWPGLDYLAEKTRLSKRGVQYAIKHCMESGELLLERPGARGRSNLYRVDVQTLQGKPVRLGATDDDIGGKSEQDRTQPIATEPPEKPKEEQQQKRKPKKTQVDGDAITDDEMALAEGIMAAFNEANGSKLSLLGTRGKPTENMKRIIMQVRGNPDLTLEDHQRIIREQFENPWWDEERAGSVSVIYSPGSFPRARAGGKRWRPRFKSERQPSKAKGPGW